MRVQRLLSSPIIAPGMDERREIWMYYHGHNQSEPGQFTRLAISTDGLTFRAWPEILGNSIAGESGIALAELKESGGHAWGPTANIGCSGLAQRHSAG